MKKQLFQITLVAVMTSSATAQNKLLTIQEAVLRGRTSLAPKRLQGLTFIPQSNSFSYIENNSIKVGDVNTAKVKDILTINELNNVLKAFKEDTLKSLTAIRWKNANQFYLGTSEGDIIYSLDKKTITDTDVKDASTVSATAGTDLESFDKASVAGVYTYCKDNNLYVSKNGKDIQVTFDGSKDIVYTGKNVHRDEFGIHKGTFWSHKGNYLAFYRMDQSMVTDYPIIDWTVRPAVNKNIKYPMAGNTSHHVTLGIYDVTNNKTLYVKTTGDPEQYLTNIAWSPDEKKIYIAVLNRGQNYMQLHEYDAATGDFIKTLFEEKNEKYVEPLNPMLFLPNNANQFIWQSRRDGFNHFYLYDVSGKLIKQLTKGNWEVKSENGFDTKSECLFFHANAESPVNQDFYSVNVKTAKTERITSGSGFHTCVLDEKGSFIIDNFSSTNIPREYSIINTTTKKSISIFKAENPIKEYKTGTWNLFSIKNNEGTDLYCRLFKPVDFDSTKKYPVVVYLYNGPHSQMVTNTWMAGGELWHEYMAQKGFIVFTVDGRGTDYRGTAFSQATHRQLGNKEMEDQLTGISYLKSLPYVDGNRLGVHGWSFGGFMTTSLMTRNPNVFKVGVAGGPVIDWSYYEIMYTERYMDTPQENPQGYNENNTLNYVDKLKGKFLMIHGAQDPVVVWEHSIMYQKKAVDKGVQMDYYVYPGHEHNVSGKDRAHLMEKITNYFIDNL